MKESKESEKKCVNHLANERTFLAWIRTSVGLMAFGFVVERFSLFADLFMKEKHFSNTSLPGLILIALGALIAIMAFIGYRKNLGAIEDNSYHPAKQLPLFLTLLIIIMGGFLAYFLIARPN